ncbi:MAG: hypothetical protein ABFD20_00250 [Anaerolineales bacterium]
MVAQSINNSYDESSIEPSDSTPPSETQSSSRGHPLADDEFSVDQGIEDVISAEGEGQPDRAKRASSGPSSASDVDTSLDDLLDSFADEALAEDALADAEAYRLDNRLRSTPSTGPTAARESLAEPITPASSESATRTTETTPSPDAGGPTAQAPVAGSALLAQTRQHRQGIGFWRSLGLVLLGAALGAALALAILWSRAGTLDYAARAQVDALSNNMNTMHSNQELTWQRLNEAVPQLSAQDARIAALEEELSLAQERAADAQSQVAALTEQVTALQEQLSTALEQAEARMATVEGQAAALDEQIADVQSSIDPLKTDVGRFDGFFTSLRDLLIQLQGKP